MSNYYQIRLSHLSAESMISEFGGLAVLYETCHIEMDDDYGDARGSLRRYGEAASNMCISFPSCWKSKLFKSSVSIRHI